MLSILIPIYNEAETLPTLLDRLWAVPFPVPIELVIVNDGSTDRTRAVLEAGCHGRPNVRVFHRERNEGKAAAIRMAMAEARGTVFVMQDADLELDPADLPTLLEPILRGEADVVFGSRFLDGRAGAPLHRAGNRLLTALANRWYGARLTDMETCYKMARADVFRRLRIEGRGFELEPELTAKILRSGWVIHERPVRYRPRNRRAGKKIRWRDGWAAVLTLWRYRRYYAAGGEHTDEREKVQQKSAIPIGKEGGHDQGVVADHRHQ